MPIPPVSNYETKEEFISACMAIEIGSGKDESQAYAICNSIYTESKLSRMKRLRDVVKKSTYKG
jgi:hypothetical protein